jgi:hypothetical protein
MRTGPLSACVLLLAYISLAPPSTSAQTAEIVLYSSDVTTIAGNWARLSSTTGAGGQKMSSVDRGGSAIDAPLASPVDYFETTFTAAAGVPYRLWLRMRATANSKFNESVWVQYDGAVTSGGAPIWRIGSTSALLVNLENCSACGVAEWGWQDNAWWLGTSSVVRFAVGGPQRLRVQTREDGVDIDQIVLSPATYFSLPPGPVRNDRTIVPKTGASITLLRAPYLQQLGDDRVVIVWTTRESGAADVRYRAGAGPLVTVAAESRTFTAAATGLSFDFYQHEAELVGLAPSTRYTYDVFVGNVDATVSATDAFTTAPLVGTGTVRFIAFGDSGVGSTAQRQLADRMTADSFDLALHAGDIAYGNSAGTGGGSYRQFDDWVFGVYGPWMRSRPLFPSIGNHENEVAAARPYRDVFVLPEGGATAAFPDHAERFYSFDYGPVHFVALDTETAFQTLSRRQAQLAWLDADLASTTQPWKIVFLHRPPYNAGTRHGSDLAVRAAFAPIFEARGVQLVISAHEHDYERTRPLRQHQAEGAAVTYLVTGGGGAPLYPSATGPWTAFSASRHHYVRGVVGNCVLSLEAVGLGDTVFDRADLDRCNPPDPEPLAWPVPGTIQAEDFDAGANGVAYRDLDAGNNGRQYRATDVDIQRCGEGGFNVGWVGAGEWLDYTVNVAAAGTYTLTARVASPATGGRFRVLVDGVDLTGALQVPTTGGWQTWRDVSVAVTLPAGIRKMRLSMETNGSTGAVGNFNFVRLTP